MDKKNVGLNWLLNIDLIVAGVSLAILVSITLLGALSRYFLNNPFTWMEELQLLLEVWVVFLGAGYAFRVGGHVAIELLVDALPEKMQKVMEIIIAAVVLVTMGYLLYQSFGYFQLFERSGRTTSIMQIPYTFIYGIVPISCINIILSFVYVFVNKLRGIDITKGVEM